MSLMVRLQGLPPNAEPNHIRNFFTGLKIRFGGVNIIGGVHGEAFVRFASNRDVSLSLRRSGNSLMDAPIFISLYDSEYKAAYLRISFRPLDARISDVKRLFKELSIDRVIFLTRNKVRSGEALIKFKNISHLPKLLSVFQLPKDKNSKKGHKKQETFSVLSMRKSSEKEWISSGGKIDPCPKNNNQASSGNCKWLPEMSVDDYRTLYIHEFYAHLMNVSLCVEKSHIRKFLYNLVGDSQITFVYDKNGIRQREGFVMFITENDYVRALELDKAVLKGRRLRVLPISKANMMELIASKREVDLGNPVSEKKVLEPDVKFLYLRNFAACVNKLDVLNFFTGFSLNEKDICLLYDDNGDSLGEALVKFSSKEEASKAKKLNHKRFQGTEILLRCISKGQLKVFGVDCFLNRSTGNRDSSTNMELCGAEISVSTANDSREVACDAV